MCNIINIKLNKLAILKALTFLTFVVIIITIPILQDFESNSRFLINKTIFVLESTCECRKWQKLLIVKNNKKYSGNFSKIQNLNFEIT